MTENMEVHVYEKWKKKSQQIKNKKIKPPSTTSITKMEENNINYQPCTPANTLFPIILGACSLPFSMTTIL